MINNIFIDKKNIYLSLVLFFIILIFSIWSKPNLIPNLSPDSYGYIRLAKDFQSDISEIRPFFFPLFIRMCLEINEANWQKLFLIIQLVMHATLATYIFSLFQKIPLKKGISFFLTLLIGLNPSLIYYSTYLLAESLFAILTTLLWIFTIEYIRNMDSNKINYTYLVLIGLSSGLSIVTKPIALFIIFPIIFSILLTTKSSWIVVKSIFFILIINFSFYQFWENYKKKNNPELKFELLDSIEHGINMTALRAGMVDYGKGTVLYNYIVENGMLDEAKNFKIKMSYTMNTQANYLDFKNSIPWEIQNDKSFAIQIIKTAPLKLFLFSISNWHSFFTKRSFGPGDESFPGMPNIMRKLYYSTYSLLYRPFLLFMITFSFYILWVRKSLDILYPSGSLILYASLTVAVLTAHGGEFPRYRVWVEYIMWFCSLLPLGFLMQLLHAKLKRV